MFLVWWEQASSCIKGRRKQEHLMYLKSLLKSLFMFLNSKNF